MKRNRCPHGERYVNHRPKIWKPVDLDSVRSFSQRPECAARVGKMHSLLVEHRRIPPAMNETNIGFGGFSGLKIETFKTQE